MPTKNECNSAEGPGTAEVTVPPPPALLPSFCTSRYYWHHDTLLRGRNQGRIGYQREMSYYYYSQQSNHENTYGTVKKT